MRLISWNVNGLRACVKKGYLEFIAVSEADVVCLQEVRAFPEQLEMNVRSPDGWHASFSPAERPGYSGVGIYSRQAPSKIDRSVDDERFDIEGRFIMAHFGRTAIASVYFPKGNGKNRDNSRVPYKLGFYEAVKRKIDKARKRGPVFVVGDYNTAHHEIDLARPKTNQKSSGFLPEERQVMTDWVDDGWVDVFRQQHPGEVGHYSWWRQWGNARADNVGWRIDYILASRSAARKVSNAYILKDVKGSDHCPVGVDVN
ncbi:MAG: exodeoxyribonuclease III [bacterium]|nr:exodeoxyribonuclease III [Gammaproteobacteria bacterium]HIL94573.1 exodeoxyribonuclease III [Pseudomonadales bacterium]